MNKRIGLLIATFVVLIALVAAVSVTQSASAREVTLMGQPLAQGAGGGLTFCVQSDAPGPELLTLTYEGERLGSHVVLRGSLLSASFSRVFDVMDVHDLATDTFALTFYDGDAAVEIHLGQWDEATGTGSSTYAQAGGSFGEIGWMAVECPPPPSDKVPVPAGEFQMGCDPDHNGGFDCEWYELPLHTVYLDMYAIDRTEVTNAEYADFLNARDSNDCGGFECVDLDDPDSHITITLPSEQYIVEAGYEDHPMGEVTWYGANSYCTESGDRLPTEAEWEKAARGTTIRAYPWGDGAPDCTLANGNNCVGDTTAVASYPWGASQYGVLDMAGNVEEWTNDWYGSDYYSSSPYDNPQGPENGEVKMVRGGNYTSEWFWQRAASRPSREPIESYSYLGFRCASAPADKVAVPAGEFQMGCDPGHNGGYSCSGEELPLHTVYLDAYEIDNLEVTNSEYVEFLNDRDSNDCGGFECVDLDDPDSHIMPEEDHYIIDPDYVDHPVIEVTWYGANSYCSETGGRLPTEAEWEKAARGTTVRSYPWGDSAPDCTLTNGNNCVGDTTAVGSYPVLSQYGALDMAGNVWEWTNDWYASDYYSSSPYANPPGPENGLYRVARGGAWNNNWNNMRVADRSVSSSPINSSYDIGFRCAYAPGY